jgi:carbonic anhydrase
MKKLVRGIIDFRNHVRPSYRETFAHLALGQSPDTLFIACSDSRVVPNVFASSDPGDVFVIRNVGNLVAPCGGDHGLSIADESEAAAIEFAVQNLGVRDVIICGHSECGAMHGLLKGREKIKTPNLRAWLRHGENALNALNQGKIAFDPALALHNRLSQLNVLQQIENLKSYPIIESKIVSKELRIHAWWFELANAIVYYFEEESRKFIEIDESHADRIIDSIE